LDWFDGFNTTKLYAPAAGLRAVLLNMSDALAKYEIFVPFAQGPAVYMQGLDVQLFTRELLTYSNILEIPDASLALALNVICWLLLGLAMLLVTVKLGGVESVAGPPLMAATTAGYHAFAIAILPAVVGCIPSAKLLAANVAA
jgi:hypothetical protein